MYFGQSDGLYSCPWKNYFPFEIQNPFTKIQAADGQVWSTAEFAKLVVGHHEGFDHDYISIRRLQGMTRVREPGRLALGWYAHGGQTMKDYRYTKNKQGPQLHHKIEGLKESCPLWLKPEKSNLGIASLPREFTAIKFTDLSWTRAEVKTLYISKAPFAIWFQQLCFSIAGKPVFELKKECIYIYLSGREKYRVCACWWF